MLQILIFLLFSQDIISKPITSKEVNYPFVKINALNSANNCFKPECIEYWVKNWNQIPVVLLIDDKETVVGKAVCAHVQNGWIVAKISLDQSVPDTYVCRTHTKPISVSISDGCNFEIKKAELIRLLLVNPLYASKYPEEDKKKILIGN